MTCFPLRTSSALALLLAAGAVAATPLAPVHELLQDPRDRFVGWYRLGDADARVTYRPGGGLYCITLGPGLEARALLPSPQGDCFEWGEGGTACFDGGRRRARALRWHEADGSRGWARRSREDPYEQGQVAFVSDGLRLVGTLFVPRGAGPFPAAALIQGAGTSSRGNLWAWTFADGLARRGVAVLLPDKRGSGESEGDWQAADFDDLAGDAAASLAALRSLPEVDAARTGFVGLSQGGWVAPLAARRTEVAFCASLVCSATSPAEQVRHEARNDFREAGLDAAEIARLDEAMAALLEVTRSGQGWSAYRSLAEASTASPRTAFARSYFPDDPESATVRFWEGIVDHEPLQHWRALTVPRLVVLGAEDEADNTPVAESLRLLGSVYADDPSVDLEVRVQPRSGHALEDDRLGWVSQEVLADLALWIQRRTAP